jgi:general secretion pathway protein E
VLYGWVIMWALMYRDCTVALMKHEVWDTLVFVTGMAPLLLAMLVNGGFLFLTIIGLPIIGAVYVRKRNALVPDDARIFTGRHFRLLGKRALKSVGIKLKETTLADGKVGGAATKILLMRKDGKTLEMISGALLASDANQSDAVQAVKQVIESSINARATDIHVEPTANALNIRFRIDGILHPLPPYPAALGPSMVSVIKVLSDMNIAEKRRPQDGTFTGQLDNKDLDFRVATSATVYGETMSLRILDRNRELITLDKLGMDPKMRARFQQLVNGPHGMIVVSGPTGAGKTTTLYAALMELDAFQKNIMTIEDPIEYSVNNITQMSLNPKAGITFASALRSILRQDPNVIMVGEIRDAETARVAMQAAMTGHMVLTTLHANDTVISLFRLLDLGVEQYLISSSLACILAQRLVRILCTQCRAPYEPRADFLPKIGLKPNPNQPVYFYKAVGCPACNGTGYYGRTGVFEMLAPNDRIREIVRTNPSEKLIRDEARKIGLRTLMEDGVGKVVQGATSLKELQRVTK